MTADPAHLTGSHLADSLEDGWNEWEQVVQSDTPGIQDYHAESRHCQILLEQQISVRSQKDFEAVSNGSPQQFAVPSTSPALLLNRSDLVSDEPSSKRARHLLIQ